MAVPEDTGYPLKWFKTKESVRDMWECAVCLQVVKDPVQVSGCGHQFCRYCLDNVLQTQPRCPTCRGHISEEVVFDDTAAKRAIGKLEVNCPNRRCEWDGKLNSLLREHTARCSFTVLNCSNVGCDMQVIRQDLEVHLTKCEHRTVGCEHCNSKHVFMDKAAHLQTCTHLPVECIKCSLGKVPRNKMEAHIDTTCPKTVIECKYSEFGCEHEVNAPIHVMTITDFNRKLSEAKEKNVPGDIDDDPFYTSTHGYKLKMRLQLNDRREQYKDQLGVYVCVMKSDHDAILSWPFKKKYTFTLIDQQDNEEERKNITHTVTPEGEDEFKKPIEKENKGRGKPAFVSHATLKTRKYIEDGTVFITVTIEP